MGNDGATLVPTFSPLLPSPPHPERDVRPGGQLDAGITAVRAGQFRECHLPRIDHLNGETAVGGQCQHTKRGLTVAKVKQIVFARYPGAGHIPVNVYRNYVPGGRIFDDATQKGDARGTLPSEWI